MGAFDGGDPAPASGAAAVTAVPEEPELEFAYVDLQAFVTFDDERCEIRGTGAEMEGRSGEMEAVVLPHGSAAIENSSDIRADVRVLVQFTDADGVIFDEDLAHAFVRSGERVRVEKEGLGKAKSLLPEALLCRFSVASAQSTELLAVKEIEAEDAATQTEAPEESIFAAQTGDLAAFVTIDDVQCLYWGGSFRPPTLSAAIENRSRFLAYVQAYVLFTDAVGVVYASTLLVSDVHPGERERVTTTPRSSDWESPYPEVVRCRFRDISASSK